MNEIMRDSQMESREKKEVFTGSYGLVLKPDQETMERAKLKAHLLVPNAPFIVEKPHITLYHARFNDLPVNEVQRVYKIIEGLEGESLKLKDLQVFGGKFLFWNIVKSEQIQKAHEKTLELSKYLDQQVQARALEESLSLTEEEIESLKKFGHPLMKDLYLPHITLAYDPKGIVLDKENMVEEYDMQVESVNFAEIGEYGVVKKIIEFEIDNK
jgi:2'-5' RNA ligase